VSSTVLIVDDHQGFRTYAHRLLVAEGFDVIGEAADGPASIQAAQRLRPDVVLLDINLPGLDGIACAEAMAAMVPAPAVILMSSREQRDFGRRLADAPARGFIPKWDLSGSAIHGLLDGVPS
jgi:DNA-binding NarL/FixJ family response regulator